jgi:Domain of unknown function (DUF4129)
LTRRLAIAALVLPALVLVALAARSYRPFTGGETGGQREASMTFLDSVFTITLVIAVVLAIIGLWLRVPRRGGKPGAASPYSGLVVLLVLALAASVMGRALMQYEPRPQEPESTDAALPGKLRPGQPVAEEDMERSPRVVWPLAVALAALVLASVIVLVIVDRRRSRAAARSPEELEELARALDEAIEDLRRDPDPRRAVVAAYARMEQALSYYGLPRRPSEAPYEYLGRVGRELDAQEQVAALTELFEEAKFSEHSVDESMRGRAIDALSSVRREVRAAT